MITLVPRKRTVHPLPALNRRALCINDVGKASEMYGSPTLHGARNPSVFCVAPMHAFGPAHITGRRRAVHLVFRNRSKPQVLQPIVGPVGVNVIDNSGRPRAIAHSPDHPVCREGTVKDCSVQIPTGISGGEGWFVCISSIPDGAVFGGALLAARKKAGIATFPPQQAAVSVKLQNIVQEFWGLYHVNHVANLRFAARAGCGGANAPRPDIIPYFEGDSKK